MLVIDLQPTETMDHANFDTGKWLAYCGQCPVPEVGNVFRRAGIAFRSVSGWLAQESAWERIDAVGARRRRPRARCATPATGSWATCTRACWMSSTDLTTAATTFGSHVEVLEFDDLRERVEQVTDAEIDRAASTWPARCSPSTTSVNDDDFAWGARVSVGLDRLVEDFDLDSARLLPPRPRRRAARTARRRHDPRRLAPDGPGHPDDRRVRAADLRRQLADAGRSAPADRSPRSRR